MSNASDFVIENGVLKKYVGPGGDVVIPNEVVSIGNAAFDGCKKLKSVVIPNSVTAIGNYAFADCKNLESISIPKQVSTIGDAAFRNCGKLTDSNGFVIASNTLYHYGGEQQEVIIPDSVTKISSWAFENRSTLLSVVIPEGVTSIGFGAFFRCSALQSVKIPNSVTSIGSSAFSCSSLQSVEIPSSLTSYGENVFSGCKQLKIIISPAVPFEKYESVQEKQLAALGFAQNQNRFQNLIIAEGYKKYLVSQRKKILPRIFADDCAEALSIYNETGKITAANFESDYLIPAKQANAVGCIAYLLSIENISKNFREAERQLEQALNKDPYNTTEMKQQWSYKKRPDGTLEITAYKGNSQSILIPFRIGKTTVSAIGDFSFNPSSSVNRKLEDRVQTLKNITNVEIPDSVVAIGRSAFSGCTMLQSVKIPESVTDIAFSAFFECPNLTIYTPSGSEAEKHSQKFNIPFVAE